MKATMTPDVADVFNSYPRDIQQRLRRLRKLILDTASETDGVGPIHETLISLLSRTTNEPPVTETSPSS
jgi:hypothetical protein